MVAVQLVDKMRIKREFEATLPPLNGTEQELVVRAVMRRIILGDERDAVKIGPNR